MKPSFVKQGLDCEGDWGIPHVPCEDSITVNQKHRIGNVLLDQIQRVSIQNDCPQYCIRVDRSKVPALVSGLEELGCQRTTGESQTLCIMSDSFNTLGGMLDLQESGDLPPDEFLTVVEVSTTPLIPWGEYKNSIVYWNTPANHVVVMKIITYSPY